MIATESDLHSMQSSLLCAAGSVGRRWVRGWLTAGGLGAPGVGFFHRSLAAGGDVSLVALEARHDAASSALHAGTERLNVLPAGGHRTAGLWWGRIVGEGRHSDESNHGDSAENLAELHRISPGCLVESGNRSEVTYTVTRSSSDP